MVADVVGGDAFADLLSVLRPMGRYVTAGAIAGPVVSNEALAARQSILSPRQTRHSVTKAVDKLIVEFKESHWRWSFWLVLDALLIEGVLRVPTAILQIGRVLPTEFPPGT